MIKIHFQDRSEFSIEFDSLKISNTPIPFWASFENMPCPGNVKHGPEIDYCRLSVEIETLIHYFSDIKSIEKGTLKILKSETLQLKIDNDAQNLFFQAVWFILLNSQCSIFKFNQWARGNYLPSTDPKRMYYTLFSIFLIEHYFTASEKLPDIEKFKSELLMLRITLKNLLSRIRKGRKTKSDSVNNGIALFDTLLIHLLELINVEGQHSGLAETIKKGSVLTHWV
jgi:hypothetical protein